MARDSEALKLWSLEEYARVLARKAEREIVMFKAAVGEKDLDRNSCSLANEAFWILLSTISKNSLIVQLVVVAFYELRITAVCVQSRPLAFRETLH